MKKFFLILIIILSFFLGNILEVNAGGAINFSRVKDKTKEITDKSISSSYGNFEGGIENISKNIFQTVKIIIGGLLVIYIVYSGIMMTISMGDDEEKLSSAKRSLRYSIIALLFINIPGTLFDTFGTNKSAETTTLNKSSFANIGNWNIFANNEALGNTLGSIITFLQISIVSIAIFIIVLSGIKIIISFGKEENITEQKNKILWSLGGLIFIGIMEIWRTIVFEGRFTGTTDLISGDYKPGLFEKLFSSMSDLALFFAGPIAIFFLSLAGYYYITGDEEKIKKAKSIVINTLIATALLLGIYSFLNDLGGALGSFNP